MKSEFAGASVVVTGAGSGIGRGIALGFAARGANVVVADRDRAGGEETVRAIAKAGGTAELEPADVTSEPDIERIVARACAFNGRLDVWVNNAAVLGPWLPIGEHTAETIDAVIDVNVKGVVLGMKHALRVMARQRAGVVVNLASVQGFRVVYPGSSLYAASKAAVVSLTKAAALEYGQYGVRVVAIAPGPIDTPMLRSASPGVWPPAIVNDVPLARVGEPDDVARAIVWLASKEAAYITGVTLPVDGGFLAP
jgi:NAD(P)-dependent dehydrogenase (short-subunit alcohol dehydrogenase family)